MGESIAPIPLHARTVKAEEEKLLAGRLCKYKAFSAQKDYTAVHCGANELREDVFGCIQRDTLDPKAEPAPDPNAAGLRTETVGHSSIAWVLAEGEVKAGEKVQTVAGGKVKKLEEGKNAVGKAMTTGKNVEIEVELF
jgi:hypothetical protein